MTGPFSLFGTAAAALLLNGFGVPDDIDTLRYRHSYREPPRSPEGPITIAERNRRLNAQAAKAKKYAKRKAATKARRAK